jgi:RNA polymerase sigma-70 factor (ECF subfamily)
VVRTTHHSPDRDAWLQFVDIYAPLVYRLARRHGFQDADAADLTQDVLHAVSRAARNLDYDPKRGSFRAWLFTVARNKVRSFLARRKRRFQRDGTPGGGDVLDEQPAPEETALWEQEYEQRLFDWAAEQVRDSFQSATWQAFWGTAVEGRPPAMVAKEVGISVGAIYIAKSRVLARLREQIRQLEE